jgi:hypothetical protein
MNLFNRQQSYYNVRNGFYENLKDKYKLFYECFFFFVLKLIFSVTGFGPEKVIFVHGCCIG